MRGYSSLQLCALAACITNTLSHSFPPNANHIFNAIHSSMRQWGSSLNHNGMSFFLATVPEGTQLYHGSWWSDPVQGPEWLAFEAEHALVFTHPFPHNPPPDDESPPPPPQLQLGSQLQRVMERKPRKDRTQAEDGWLHTFAAAKNLRLLYVDGTSAGKTDNGTLDSQDRILFRDGMQDDAGMVDERERAALFCQMVRERWNDRLDGLIRMEAGFEIILCDFARNLELLRVTRVRLSEKGVPGDEVGKHAGELWLPAVASRYWGIGGDRVILNYNHFVTAFAYGVDLFVAGKNSHPRLEQLSAEELEPMQRDLDLLILNHEPGERSTNWQGVADMVIQRYGTRLRYLASGQASTLQQLQEEIEDLVTPFIDYERRNTSAEVERCSMQFIKRRRSTTSPGPGANVAADAVLSVSRSVCTTLLESLQQTEYNSVVQEIKGLIEYLSWSTWKDCSGCGDHELCMIPMWPVGTVDDYNLPRCRDISQLNGDGPRYWGRFPRRRKSTQSPPSRLSLKN